MSASALIAIADGSEEMEVVIVVDVLRRAGIKVTIASVNTGSTTVTAARGTTIVADTTIAHAANSRFDLIVLPGGMPGAANLGNSEELIEMLRRQAAADAWIAAICAAPAVVLQQHGFLHRAGKAVRATCHPSFHQQLGTQHCLSGERVVVDGNIVTSQAPGTAFEFALELIRLLCGDAKRDEVAGPLVLPANALRSIGA